MPEEQEQRSPESVNLLSCYFKAREDSGPDKDVIMLCEMLGNEIQSVSIRVAAEPMTRYARLNWAR